MPGMTMMYKVVDAPLLDNVKGGALVVTAIEAVK